MASNNALFTSQKPAISMATIGRSFIQSQGQLE
jgi:hypothetical protein